MLLAVTAAALATRVLFLATAPPGLRYAEAGSALYAQTIGGDVKPIFFIGPHDAREPLFYYVARLTGGLAGWDVAGPRLAAAVLGTLAAIGCALWMARALGRRWGLLAGLLAATSFWQLIYSRQALQPIAAAACAAFGLWALARALDDDEAGDSPRYLAAGALFGLGFYADISFRLILPALLVIAGYLWLAGRHGARQRRGTSAARLRGAALMLLTTALVMAPLVSYYGAHPESFELGFELAGDWPDGLLDAGWDYLLTLQLLLWKGPADWAVNLPGRPLLDPLLAIWSVVGVLAALRHPLRPLHGIVVLWLLIFALPAALLNSDDPGLLMAAMPAVFALPVLGMHAVWKLSGERNVAQRVRPLTTFLIAGSVVASAAWSGYDYFRHWADAPETYAAFQGDVRDSLAAIERLPYDDTPVYFSAHELDRILRYLAPDHPRRDFTNPALLPVPATGRAYLIYPHSTEPDSQLLAYLDPVELVETGYGPDDAPVYRVWLLDLRIRERLPRAAPAVFFSNGYQLLGYEVTPATDRPPAERIVDVLFKWRVPTGARWARARASFDLSGERAELFETHGEIVIEPWRDERYQPGELILTHIRMPFPDVDPPIADLLAGLFDPNGEPLEPSGAGVLIVADTQAIVTRIAFLP
jgi:hypothetical protein